MTVIIAAHNARPWLRASVESLLNQTYHNLEVIVVDDGSTDGTIHALEGIDDPRLHCRRQEHAYKSVALNRALDETTGEFFAIQDADDLSHPTRIEEQLHCFLANEDLAAVFCGHELLLGHHRVAPRMCFLDRDACRRAVARLRMPAHDPTGMFRRRLVQHLRFDPTLDIAQGYDYVLRVGEEHPMLVLGRCLYTYRVHDQSRTRSDVGRRVALVQQVRKRACERRGLSESEARILLDADAEPTGARRRDNNLPVHFVESVLNLRRDHRWWTAVATALACVRLQPLALRYYQPLAYAILPVAVVAALRRPD